ncbi:MAG: thioredoxin fold domain-containing protein [Candidatus Latescibacteria bacterium]|nr:thioredoxin fold domain-containing protein [Candidatus Latescibacterota bacterium]
MKMSTAVLTVTFLLLVAGACGQNNEQATAQQGTGGASGVKPAAARTVEGKFKWYHDWDTGMAAAKKEKKPVLVHFTADWCKFCVKMKKETYASDMIQKRFKNSWIGIMIDTEEKGATGTVYVNESKRSALTYLQGENASFTPKKLGNQELLQFFGGMGLPTLLFIDKDGTPVQKISSFIPKEEFAVILDFFKEEAYKSVSYDDFKKKHRQRG